MPPAAWGLAAVESDQEDGSQNLVEDNSGTLSCHIMSWHVMSCHVPSSPQGQRALLKRVLPPVLAAALLLAVAVLFMAKGGVAEAGSGFTQGYEKEGQGGTLPEHGTAWKALIAGTSCDEITGEITCEIRGGVRHFKFPAGKFDIDEQVMVPAHTAIEGNANPNDPSDKTKKPDPSTQTVFVATKGQSDVHAAYCGTNNNMQQGDAQNLRIGFLLHSNTAVKNINFQGRDVVRPYDNGNLCGGGAFETPGCMSPGFGDGVGTGWQNKVGCFDHTGKANNLITGDGKGVENVVIENVRLNDWLLPSNPSQAELVNGQGSQVAVWLAMTQDGSATTNVRVTNLVSMLTRADGINFHGNIQDSVAEDCHIENTGDDIYAIWGAYAMNPSGVVFRNNVGKNAGVTRNYGYGVCVAIYGTKEATVSGTKCYDKKEWNAGQAPHGNAQCLNGAFCNSCLAYVHDGWFGAVYPDGNTVKLYDNEYFYLGGDQKIPSADRPLTRVDWNSKAHVLTNGQQAPVMR